MSNWKTIALFMLAVSASISACHADNKQIHAVADNDFPARVLRMAKGIHDEVNRDVSALQGIDKHSISRDYGPSMARIFMARRAATGAPYLMGMITASRYCWIDLKPGDECGLSHLPESQAINGHTFDGYLFISDWVHSGGGRYFLMAISLVGPQETVIARVTYNDGVKVLYDSSRRRNPGCPLPAEAAIARIDSVYRVKTLSPTQYELYEGSYTEPTQAAVLQLSLGASSCALKVLSPSQVGREIP